MSGISGYGRVDASEFTTSDETSGAASGGDAAPAPEAQVTRGSVPAAPTDALLQMKTSELQSQLMETGLSKTEAKLQAKEIKATAAEVAELEEELAWLEGLEQMYEDMLADPSMDDWYSSWIMADLWDVRMDIYDVKDKLGRLEGDLKELLGNCWSGMLGAIDFGIKFGQLRGQESTDKSKIADMERSFEEKRRELKAKVDRSERQLRELLEEKGFVIPVPPQSDIARTLTKELSRKLERAKLVRTDESLEALRDVRKKFAGAS